MEKKEFLNVSREYFKQMGFQKIKNSRFFYESNDVLLQVYLVHSNFSELYYIDYYIIIKELHNENIYENFDSHIDLQGRFGGKNYQVEIEYEKINVTDYIQLLDQQVKIHICPVINEGVRGLKKLPQLFVYKLPVQEYLKRIK